MKNDIEIRAPIIDWIYSYLSTSSAAFYFIEDLDKYPGQLSNDKLIDLYFIAHDLDSNDINMIDSYN